jgi:hypothetical protein
MENNPTPAWSALFRAVGGLERAAAAGIVPGELRPWCRSLTAVLEPVRRAWTAHADEERAIRERILEEDLELASRVATLERRGRELERGLAGLGELAAELLQEDMQSPTSSREPTARVRLLRKSTLAWIADLRAHDGELCTWLVEALQRDRGVAD